MTDINLDRFTKYPIKLAVTTPNTDGLYQLFSNRYWVVVDECLLFYAGESPQCNMLKEVVESMAKGHEVRFLDVVYIPVRETYDGTEFAI